VSAESGLALQIDAFFWFLFFHYVNDFKEGLCIWVAFICTCNLMVSAESGLVLQIDAFFWCLFFHYVNDFNFINKLSVF